MQLYFHCKMYVLQSILIICFTTILNISYQFWSSIWMFNPQIVNDHLAYRYQILAVIGHGYSGEVLKCLDYKTKESVAIKVIRNKDR